MHETSEPDPGGKFELLAALAPPGWFGYHGMHRRAARTLAVLLATTVAAETVVTLVVRQFGLQDTFLWYLGQSQPNTVRIVLFGWAIWCGWGARRWRAADVEGASVSRVSFGIAWMLLAGFAWSATFVVLALAYVLLGYTQ